MEERTRTIIISFMVFLAAIGVIYFLDLPKYKALSNESKQFAQLSATISSKKAYTDTIVVQAQTLEDAGWVAIEPSLAINFTNTPFFIPKMSYFFQTVTGSSGMTMGAITYSAATPLKGAPAQTTTQSGEGSIKVSGTSSTQQESQTTTPSKYAGQLIGPVKKTTFNLTVTGTYGAFKNLLTQLENQTRIVTVKNITLLGSSVSAQQQTTGSKSKTQKTLSSISNFQLVVDTYSY